MKVFPAPACSFFFFFDFVLIIMYYPRRRENFVDELEEKRKKVDAVNADEIKWTDRERGS